MNIIMAATGVLFLLICVVMQQLITRIVNDREHKGRLSYRSSQSWRRRVDERLQKFEQLYLHLSDMLEAMVWPLQPSGFLLLCGMLLLFGVAAGGLLFQSARGMLLLGFVLSALPYLLLRMSLTQRQMKTRLDFLPAVELFYQCYLVTGGRQIRVALRRTVEEQRLLGPIQTVFEQLYRNLSVRGDDEASLRLFSAALGHIWSDYFVQILRVNLAEGHPIADNLKTLITDMRKARRANQQERNRLLEIRIANFSPVFFLVIFLGINLRYNAEQAVYYYFFDPHGRDMLLNAIVLIVLSFGMGLYLSQKKM